jgi:hypothetical protein
MLHEECTFTSNSLDTKATNHVEITFLYRNRSDGIMGHRHVDFSRRLPGSCTAYRCRCFLLIAFLAPAPVFYIVRNEDVFLYLHLIFLSGILYMQGHSRRLDFLFVIAIQQVYAKESLREIFPLKHNTIAFSKHVNYINLSGNCVTYPLR